MKSKYVNVVRIVVIFIIIFSILTSCGKKTDLLNLNGTIIDTNKLAPVTLNIYMMEKEIISPREVLDKIAEDTHLNIKLNIKGRPSGSYGEFIKTAIASNEKPDAFMFFNEPEITSMFRKGEIKDISALLPKYAPTIYEQLSDQQLNAAKVDGKLIAIPSLFPQANYVTVDVRQDLIKKYNISSINTFEDYGELLKKIKANGYASPGSLLDYRIDMFAGAYGYAVLDYTQNLVYKWDDPRMKIIPWEQTPEFKEIANFLNNWFKNKYINLGEKGYNKNSPLSTLSLTSSSSESPIESNGSIYNRYILYKNKKIQRFSPVSNSNIYFGSNSQYCAAVVFNSNSNNTERALMFLNWIQSSQKNYDLFMYGIKDKHYKLKDNRISMPKGIIYSPCFWWPNAAFYNINFDRLIYNSYPDSLQRSDEIKFVNTKTQYAPHEGFYPNYDNVQEYCNMRRHVYQSRMQHVFYSTSHFNEMDEIINELKDTGGTDEIVREIQMQLDRWMAEQKK